MWFSTCAGRAYEVELTGSPCSRCKSPRAVLEDGNRLRWAPGWSGSLLTMALSRSQRRSKTSEVSCRPTNVPLRTVFPSAGTHTFRSLRRQRWRLDLVVGHGARENPILRARRAAVKAAVVPPESVGQTTSRWTRDAFSPTWWPAWTSSGLRDRLVEDPHMVSGSVRAALRPERSRNASPVASAKQNIGGSRSRP